MAEVYVPVVLYASVVMFFGVIGNTVVCYISRYRLHRNALNNFVLSLATLDLIGCTLCIPIEITEVTNRFTQPVLCLLQKLLRTSLAIASMFILLTIAVERYRRICHPLSRHIDLKQSRILIVGAVMIALLLAWPTIFIFGESRVSRTGNRNATWLATGCVTKEPMEESVYPAIYFTLLLILFLSSTTVLSALYVMISVRIWRGQKLHTDTRTKSASLPDCRRLNATLHGVDIPTAAKLFEELTRSLQRRRRRDPSTLVMVPTSSLRRKRKAVYSRKRTTFIMCLMTLTSVVSYLPYVIVSILFVAMPSLQFSEHRKSVIVILQLCLKSFLISSAVNPFIYGFCNQKFKTECRKLCHGWKCSRDTIEDNSETSPNT